LLVFVAPKLIGGRDAPTPLEGEGVATVADAIEVREWSIRPVGDDALIEAWL